MYVTSWKSGLNFNTLYLLISVLSNKAVLDFTSNHCTVYMVKHTRLEAGMDLEKYVPGSDGEAGGGLFSKEDPDDKSSSSRSKVANKSVEDTGDFLVQLTKSWNWLDVNVTGGLATLSLLSKDFFGWATLSLSLWRSLLSLEGDETASAALFSSILKRDQVCSLNWILCYVHVFSKW